MMGIWPVAGPFAFFQQVILSRWFVIYACFLVMATSGSTYIFGVYSPVLKSSLHYNQKTLNTVSFFKDFGTGFGIHSGLINDATSPFVSLLIGSAMNLSGYLLIYLSATSQISRPAVWQLYLFMFIAANAQNFADTVVIITCVKIFPESRGIVIGILKSFVGISGAIFTQLYVAFYNEDPSSLILLIAWLPAAVCVIFVFIIRIMERSDVSDTRPFYNFLYFTVLIAGYLLILIIFNKAVDFSRAQHISSGIVIIVLMLLPVVVVVNEEIKVGKKQSNLEAEISTVKDTEDSKECCNPTIKEIEDRHADMSCLSEVFHPPLRGEDYTIFQAVFSIDFLLLFLAAVCGVGGALTAIDNMGQIGMALGYPSKSISTLASLISIWNAMGRITSGFLSEIFLAKYKIPRPLMLAMVLMLACCGHLLIAFNVPKSLYVASMIVGFCLGAQWPLVYSIISEIFGLKHYSTLYNVGGLVSPAGSYILNVVVAGRLYDKEAERQNSMADEAFSSNDLICLGVKCYQSSFLIITSTTIVGVGLSMYLAARTRSFYKGDIYARFRSNVPGGEEMVGGGDTSQLKNEDCCAAHSTTSESLHIISVTSVKCTPIGVH